MAKNDIRIKDCGGLSALPTRTYQVAASATLIYAGEPVKLAAMGDQSVVKCADGEPTTSTIQFLGIAASDSTNTASVAGTVEVYDALAAPGAVYVAKAKTSSTVDTQAEIDALQNNCVVLDLTSSSFTVDAAAAHANTHGIEIVGGDPLTKEVWFRVRPIVAQGLTA